MTDPNSNSVHLAGRGGETCAPQLPPLPERDAAYRYKDPAEGYAFHQEDFTVSKSLWKSTETVDLFSATKMQAYAISAIEEHCDRMAEALESIKQWSRAYPLKVFPEPDLKRAHEVLQAAGMTLDAISAGAMRHVITKVQEIADAALNAASNRAAEAAGPNDPKRKA